MESNIKVSVCIVTFNQQEYIEQCINSVLAQETNYTYEIIVGDDASTDGTRDILLAFKKKYPDLIRLVLHEKNIGPTKNLVSVHDLAIGEYVCHLDGDDFWLPGKLSYQGRILDENPGYSQTWTFARIVNDDGVDIGIFPAVFARYIYPDVVSSKDIASSYAIVGHHSSQMYRRECRKDLVIPSGEVLDYWLAFSYSMKGDCYYSKEVLSAYRVTKAPSVTRTDSNKKATVDVLMDHLLDIGINHPEYRDKIRSNIMVRYFFSRLRGHDMAKTQSVMSETNSWRWSFSYFIKSFIWFLVQKL